VWQKGKMKNEGKVISSFKNLGRYFFPFFAFFVVFAFFLAGKKHHSGSGHILSCK